MIMRRLVVFQRRKSYLTQIGNGLRRRRGIIL
ncbi:hypothetical protein PanWU01x14_108440 [Parasponia andersonii]|uniref:Uncharacterized protein n=1 Tax=Parasponia andersonii TaxID=3476 RepID=A0A2P5CZX2_PARAD|nr:hypothetical protein PanWU01x14_108440 [Parasponia andersonii]